MIVATETLTVIRMTEDEVKMLTELADSLLHSSTKTTPLTEPQMDLLEQIRSEIY